MRPRLCGVLAEASALLAVCKSLVGDPDGADHFAAIAFDAARESGEPDLPIQVLIWNTSADRRLHGRPEVRLQRYVEGGQGFELAAAAPETRAWAAVRAADVHALLGNVEGCLRALDEASNLLADAGNHRYPWPDEHWLSGERGVSLTRLGRTSEARQALGSALAQTGEERRLDRLWWMLAMASTHLQGGDVEEAARTALGVLSAARRMRHGQLEDEVARFRSSLPSPGELGVQALDAALSGQ
jgi:hypothetical protein